MVLQVKQLPSGATHCSSGSEACSVLPLSEGSPRTRSARARIFVAPTVMASATVSSSSRFEAPVSFATAKQ